MLYQLILLQMISKKSRTGEISRKLSISKRNVLQKL